MHALSSVARETFALRWRPRGDTAVALLTAVLMVGLYYANTRAQSSVFSLLVFVILTNGVLNVLFPAYYVLVVRREGLNQLGITRRWWWLALLLSVVISVLFWPQLQQVAAQHPDIELLPLLLANGLILWEPFFVYGWLQLRFERAFGVIPGIALAAVCFGAYHIGTFPLSGVGSLVLLGLFFGLLFRVAGGNLLALWPLTWAVTSSIGVLEGGFGFGWSDVATYALLLIVQVVAIALMARHVDRPSRARQRSIRTA
jgi:membrane protease YdiL (CAAX protease family)